MRLISLPFTLSACLLVALSSGAAPFAKLSPGDWPAWRGPTGNGVAAPGQNPPLTWSSTENLLWRMPVPGKGHGSPTIVGDHVYLATADGEKQTQSIICYNRHDGSIAWESVVHKGGLDGAGHRNTSQASASVASDGERLFINFLNSKAVFTSALDLKGKVLWQKKVCDFQTHQGFGASPLLHESVVIVAADHRGGGVVAALDRLTGDLVWKQDRPTEPNYTSPALVHAGGRDQVVLAGCNRITSYDPLKGTQLWETPGSTTECVVTVVTDGERVFASGGYPKNHTMAVMADGSGKIAWQNNARVYVPSMLVKDGYVFAVMDAGMAVCWKSDTGEELWKERLGGDFYASPVLAGGRIYATNLGGATFVFTADPKRFNLLATNQLGEEVYSSPAICGGRIYLRAATRGEPRQEYLYCIGRAGPATAR